MAIFRTIKILLCTSRTYQGSSLFLLKTPSSLRSNLMSKFCWLSLKNTGRGWLKLIGNILCVRYLIKFRLRRRLSLISSMCLSQLRTLKLTMLSRLFSTPPFPTRSRMAEKQQQKIKELFSCLFLLKNRDLTQVQ